jgi:transcriptional regulator with XRE-family HTH domain
MLGLKSTREKKGLSRQELSGKTGITYANLSLIERGINVPTVRTRTRLVVALGTRINWLDTPELPTDPTVSPADWEKAERQFRFLATLVKSLPDTERKYIIMSMMRHLKMLIK